MTAKQIPEHVLRQVKTKYCLSRYILVASERRGHYVHFHNLDRSGLFPGEKMLIATVTDRESVRVEKLTDAQVKDEVMAVLRQVYPNATTATGLMAYTFQDGRNSVIFRRLIQLRIISSYALI